MMSEVWFFFILAAKGKGREGEGREGERRGGSRHVSRPRSTMDKSCSLASEGRAGRPRRKVLFP